MADETAIMTTGVSQDGDPTGTIRWEIDNISELEKDYRFSPEVEVHGIPWKCSVHKTYRPTALGVYLYGPKNDSVMWSMDVSTQFTLFNQDNTKSVIKSFTFKCDHKGSSKGLRAFMLWKNIIDEEKGFVNDDDEITIEIRFTLKNIMGFRRIPRIDFSNPDEPRTDVALVIEGQKVYVNKGFLSIHSPVFNAMFFGNFVENEKDEIELKDVEHQDFIEMLNVLYPSGKKITDENAERILSVGERFQIQSIMDQVEQFLINSSKFSDAKMLKLSGEYRLVELQGSCLDGFTRVSQITRLFNTDEYKEFTDVTKLSLLEKIMKLGN